MSLQLIEKFGVVAAVGLPMSGQRKFGVPVGGAFDLESMKLANYLVGNPVESSVFELSSAQAKFQAQSKGIMSVIGANCLIHLSPQQIESNATIPLALGETITIGAPSEGSRVYVAWSPGKKGSLMQLAELPISVSKRNHLRLIHGPQFDSFQSTGLNQVFTVSRSGNRVGIRLAESIGSHTQELPSEPQSVGTLQIANDGTPIFIGPDGPTIGGYPKVGAIISSDIGRLGQLAPGDQIQLDWVSLDQAYEINRQADELFRRLMALYDLSLSMT